MVWVLLGAGGTIRGVDVGFPSVCCEYHWLIKELLWAYSRAIGETKPNAGRKETEAEGSHGATGSKHISRGAKTLLVGHVLMVIQRLMEIG